MTLAQIKSPFPTITDTVGAAITGGRIYIGVSGLDPETNPQAVYWDEAGVTPASQPLIMKGGYIVNGSTPAQPFTAPTFSIRAYDALGNVIWYDASASAMLDSSLIGYDPTKSYPIGSIGYYIFNDFLTLERFGGAADWNGSTGTDNLTAFNAMIAAITAYAPYYSNWPKIPELRCKLGSYYFSDHIDLKIALKITGQGSGSDDFNGGTNWVFAAGKSALTLNNTNTLGGTSISPSTTSAQGTVLDGISFRSLGGGTAWNGTNYAGNTYGIWARVPLLMYNCTVSGFAGNQVQIIAFSGSGGATEGNASGWRIDRSLIREAGGNGFLVNGNDANIGLATGLQVRSCGLSGIVDDNTLGNHYVACEVDGFGGLSAGGVTYGAVTQGGVHYLLRDPTPGIGASTTPGTNKAIWYPLETGAVSAYFPAWSGVGSYQVMLPILCTGSSNGSVFLGQYIEGGIPGDLSTSGAASYDGQCSWTRDSRAQRAVSTNTRALYGNAGFGGYFAPAPGSAEATLLGLYGEVSIGSDWTDGVIIKARRESDGEQDNALRFVAGDIVWDRGLGSVIAAYRITGRYTAKQYGRGAAVPDVLEVTQFALSNPNDSTQARIWVMDTAAPTTGAHARGEIVWNSTPTVGQPKGWMCTVSGTPGTWVSMGNL